MGLFSRREGESVREREKTNEIAKMRTRPYGIQRAYFKRFITLAIFGAHRVTFSPDLYCMMLRIQMNVFADAS